MKCAGLFDVGGNRKKQLTTWMFYAWYNVWLSNFNVGGFWSSYLRDNIEYTIFSIQKMFVLQAIFLWHSGNQSMSVCLHIQLSLFLSHETNKKMSTLTILFSTNIICTTRKIAWRCSLVEEWEKYFCHHWEEWRRTRSRHES